MKNLIITSNPGVGKTTLIKEVTSPYLDKVGGFYTIEIREKNEKKGHLTRMGFRMITFSGEEAIMAYKGMKSKHRLNKYGIDMNIIENMGVRSVLDALGNKKVIVIDEIGSMEIKSQLFVETVVKCFSSSENVLATIRHRSQPFTDEIKKLHNTKIILLTRENYSKVKKEVQEWLKAV